MSNLPVMTFVLSLFFALAAMVVYVLAAVAGMLGILNAEQVLDISTHAAGSAVCGIAVTALLASIVATIAALAQRK